VFIQEIKCKLHHHFHKTYYHSHCPFIKHFKTKKKCRFAWIMDLISHQINEWSIYYSQNYHILLSIQMYGVRDLQTKNQNQICTETFAIHEISNHWKLQSLKITAKRWIVAFGFEISSDWAFKPEKITYILKSRLVYAFSIQNDLTANLVVKSKYARLSKQNFSS